MAKRSFTYRPQTKEQIERHYRIHHGWRPALAEAYKHNTTDLCEYLRSGEVPLDQQKLRDLADLIERRVGRKHGPGRKPGPIPTAGVTLQEATDHAGLLLNIMRRTQGGRAPRGAVDRAAAEAVWELAAFHISPEQVSAALRRGKASRGQRSAGAKLVARKCANARG